MGLRDDILSGMAEAAAVVAEIGELVTLKSVTADDYDPASGTVTPGETKTQTARAILDNYSLQYSGTQYADGTQIMRDDKKLFLPAAGLDWPPTLETTVTASGQAWQVVSMRTINPTGDVLAYELQVRR